MSAAAKTKFSIHRNINSKSAEEANKTKNKSAIENSSHIISRSNPNQINSRSHAYQIQSASDDTLTRLAIEEICRETAKGAVRAEKVGPSGWLPCPLRKTNKRFLRNTIKSVISHNKNQTVKLKKSEKELDEIIKGGQRRKPKFGERMHCFRRPNIDGKDRASNKNEVED